MNFFRHLSIKKKLSLIALLTCITALGLVSIAFTSNEIRSYRRTLANDLSSQARMLAGMSMAALTFEDREAVNELLVELKSQKHIDHVLVFKKGEVFAHYQRDDAPVLAEVAPPDEDGQYFTDNHLVMYRQIVNRGEPVGAIYLVANTSGLNARLSDYFKILTLVFGVATVIAVWFASRLQAAISVPVLELARVADVVAENKDYSVRASISGDDEVGRLTGAFNLMLSRIQTQDLALNTSQAKLEALVNSIDGIVWEWDPQLSQFTFVSRQCERILGYPQQQWLGDTNFRNRIIHPEDLERADQICHEAVRQGQPFAHEFRMLAMDDREVWVQASGMVQRENDGKIVFRGIFIDISAQKSAAEKLARLNEEMARTQRQAGMAEVATGVLHNVGNVLNSINVSASLLRDHVGKSQLQNLLKATSLLRDHASDTAAFLTTDPKGQKLPGFLVKLSDHLAVEQQAWKQELDGLGRNIEHIKEIVAMQQSYARLGGVSEAMNALHLVEDALRMNVAALERHGIKVVRDFAEATAVSVDKHKVLQILINLIRNAKYAMDATGRLDKTLTISIAAAGEGFVGISVKDNGVGIAPENLTRIFQHGFTTKRDGHGFGLHSGANAAREMGGRLFAQSDGPGCGAIFTLELPVASDTKLSATP